MGLVAGLLLNPISQVYLNYFVPYIDIRMRFPSPAGRIMNSALRGVMHYTLMGIFANAAQLGLPAYLKNFDPNEGYANLNSKFDTSIKVGACYWPVVHFLNY